MPGDIKTGDRVRHYFHVKAKQLATLAELPACEHPGLIGSHREEIQRIYLRDLLPRRFAVGRGMVYGEFHRSREADIVIWDADNFPSLPMVDHGFFFAESVRVVLECKSVWSTAEFDDMRKKCRAVRDIVPRTDPTLADELKLISAQVAALRTGESYAGMIHYPHHIATAGIFLRGGESFDAGFAANTGTIDDAWPDLLLLLETGVVVIKEYTEKNGILRFYNLGADALLVFTSCLLQRVGDRTVQFEAPINLLRYATLSGPTAPFASVPFPLTRPAPMRSHVWG